MKPVEEADVGDALPTSELRSVLREAPVRFAVLFGSHASGDARRTSDTDIAVEFEPVDRKDPEYNEAFFDLSASLSNVLGTEDIDLVDVHTLSPAIAETILNHGVVLVGDSARAEALLENMASERSDDPSPRERFDAALGRIDDHLGDNSAVPATERSRGER